MPLALIPLAPSPPPPSPHAPPDITVVRPFLPTAHEWEPGHRGMDLAAHGPVRSLSSGTVAFVGDVAGVPTVTVALADGRRVTYQPVVAGVPEGTVVRRGSVLGQVAASPTHCGLARACIHVGLRDDHRYWDPASLLGSRPPVLKPD